MSKAHWYDLDAEVAREREIIRTHKHPPTVKPTYKAQALRELARRLELEESLKEGKREIGKLVDKLEAVEDFLLRPTVKPLVHLNGTGARDLLEEQVKFLDKLRDLQAAIPHPNGRDYYPLEGDAMGDAQRQSQRWALYVDSMIKQAEEIAIDIQDQDARGRKTLG